MLHKYNSKKFVLIGATLAIFVASIFTVNFVFANTHEGIRPAGFVNDFAKIISPDVASSLEQKLADFSARTTIEISVVTVPELAGETIESYAEKIFSDWGIGDEEKDNGVLFLIAPTERELRIEVGYGLEGVLTDAQSFGIISKIVIPEFAKGDMSTGIVKGVDAIINVVRNESDYSYPTNEEFNWRTIINWERVPIVSLMILLWLVSVLGRSKSWWLGGVVGGLIGFILSLIFGFLFIGLISIIGLTLLGLIFDFIVSKAYHKSVRDNGHPPWWIGGGGHGGGGFGGFGGGMSGGGGASGRW